MKRTASIIIAWCVALAAGVGLDRSGALRPPVKQGDLLDALFGSARRALSAQFFVKADVYFHGGVMHMHEHGRHTHGAPPEHIRGRFRLPGAEPAHEAEHEHDHHHEAEHVHSQESGESPEHAGFEHIHDPGHEEKIAHAALGPWDIWTRLNLAIHPHEHRHLSGTRYEKELLPWLWASVRCDPHNITAWDVASYWVAERLKRPEEGLRLVEEGIRNNPDSYRLEFTRGEILLHALHNEKAAIEAFLQAERKWRIAWQKNPPEKRPDVFDYGHILLYLGALYQKQGDYARAEVWFRKARQFRHTRPDAARRLAEIARLRKAGSLSARTAASHPQGD